MLYLGTSQGTTSHGTSFYKAFIPSNIIKGFEVTGIYPINDNIFGEDEFLTSFVTDRLIETTAESANPTESTAEFTAINVTNESTAVSEASCFHSQSVKSPIMIRPFPKASARKRNSNRRKVKSAILTDSPIKAKIEAAKLKTAAGRKGKRRPPPVEDSTSESDVDEPPLLLSSTDEENFDNNITDILEEDIKKGDYLLTKVAGKKAIHFYVSEVVDILGNDEFKVKFLKRIGNSNKFVYGNENSYDILLSDIERKLPHPISAGGSERQIAQLIFQVDFSFYNVK